jgi:hypothetical protein
MSTRRPLQLLSNNTVFYSSTIYPSDCYYTSDDNRCTWMDTCPSAIPPPSHPYSTCTAAKSIDGQRQEARRRSKHIPHHLRPQHLVEQRNTRERRRVHDVNQAFHLLQTLLPWSPAVTLDHQQSESSPFTATSSRLSKARTLRTAVDYIEALQRLLNEHN